MAIRTVVTRGFGNGTFNGSIALVATRGYSIAQPLVIAAGHYHDLHSNREQYPGLTAAETQYSTLHSNREQYPGLDNDDR